MTPNQFHTSQPATAVPPPAPPPDRSATVRLRLDPTPRHLGAVDGAWWPYSTNAGDELPGLIAEVDRRLKVKVLRVGLHPDAWTNIPHRIPASGRVIRVGWFRSIDLHLLSLHTATGDNWELLVIPPETGTAAAANAFRLATQGRGSARPADILVLSGSATDTSMTAQAEYRWENEGGHLASESPS
ncbi:DUF5994 family protein [Microtetraspora sp. NBRC 16547]|uniref:DUF5994 family protein n=1 Tax=Microtetraspora sp. NBRC 16547 TaxID=3030993 RepID=UPI0024A6022A|nr:DUF5994 family protein [Microtetraspora sp. NBRC 16547]GLW98817.1 hypothetical protein Misp02_29040 [Microtetraspora sp. NBRC 16547]